MQQFDLIIAGGGVTGAGIGREATLRGFRTFLFDRYDFAFGASHCSTKLIHGGLRYLAAGHIRLVYEALRERNRLLKHIAPNLSDSLEFIYLFRRGDWIENIKISLGLLLYDVLCGWSNFKGHRLFSRARLKERFPFLDTDLVCGGVSYFDAHTDDARLTLSLIRTLRAAGDQALNYSGIEEAKYSGGLWRLRIKRLITGEIVEVEAPCLVVAAGPWTPSVLLQLGLREHPVISRLTACQGSHVIIDSDRIARKQEVNTDRVALILRAEGDKRFTFLVPQWSAVGERHYIYGTTEVEIDPAGTAEAAITPGEQNYLLKSFRKYFPRIDWLGRELNRSYCGVRPLAGNKQKSLSHISREELITWEPDNGLAVVTGGKLTTFRAMAERVMNKIERSTRHRAKRPVERNRSLWGALSASDRAALKTALESIHRGLQFSIQIWDHLVRYYGSEAESVAQIAESDLRLSEPLFDNLPFTLAEISYVCQTEDVVHLTDLMFRRLPIYFLAPDGGVARISEIGAVCGAINGWTPVRLREEIAAYKTEIERNRIAQ